MILKKNEKMKNERKIDIFQILEFTQQTAHLPTTIPALPASQPTHTTIPALPASPASPPKKCKKNDSVKFSKLIS